MNGNLWRILIAEAEFRICPGKLDQSEDCWRLGFFYHQVISSRGMEYSVAWVHVIHEPLARYVKLRVAHAPGMPGTFSPPLRVSDPHMHHGTCAKHVPRCMPGYLISGFLWSRWRGKRSRHSRRMRNPQFFVYGKRPMRVAFKHLHDQVDKWYTLQYICTLLYPICVQRDGEYIKHLAKKASILYYMSFSVLYLFNVKIYYGIQSIEKCMKHSFLWTANYQNNSRNIHKVWLCFASLWSYY